VRTLAFLTKEAVEVLRQPRLLLVLVIGPFLILLVFGAGLRDTDPALSTLFVAPDDPDLAEQVVQFAERQEGRLVVDAVVDDEDAALRRLRDGEVQLVVAFPPEVEETVRRDEQAVLRLFHVQVDPVEAQAIELYMAAAVSELNQQVLADVVAEGQTEGADVEARVQAARARLDATRTAVREIERVAGISGPEGFEAEADGLDTDLAAVESSLEDFGSLSPEVLVAPFRGETVQVAGDGVELSDFYAPAVVVVLLQHLLVTLVGLSVVRETELGTSELYRVAPLRLGELVVGKYLAFGVIGSLVTAALVGALVFGLGVPMRGDWLQLVTVLVAVLLASAGLGFCVAGVSRTDSQAVQYTMLLLLATIFLSGFVLSLDRFIPQFGWIGWLLPTTYGVEMVREVMLRGVAPSPILLGILAGYALLLGALGWLSARWRLLRA
jgi:ABC-2 type transport system permease protein